MRRIAVLVGVMALLVGASSAQAALETVTFDGLSTPNNYNGQHWGYIPASYANLNWSSSAGVGDNGWNVDNGTDYVSVYGASPGTGYVSAENFASNGSAPGSFSITDHSFLFQGAYLATWVHTLPGGSTSLTIEGYTGSIALGYTLVDTISVRLSDSFVWSGDLDWVVNKVVFKGVPEGSYWRMDNLKYDPNPQFESPVPEPASVLVWSLLAVGGGVGAGVARRRSRRQPWSPENRQAILEMIGRRA